MDLREDFGLSVAVVSPEEALTLGPRTLPRKVDVIRVLHPPSETWADLERIGFVRKPAWVTWIAPTCGDEEKFLDRLPLKIRQDIRRARRRAAESHLRYVVQQPLEPDKLDEFLALYQANVRGMRHGVPFASHLRQSLLDDSHNYAIYAVDSQSIVGGCLCLESPDAKAVRIRFSAVGHCWRARSLTRALYMEGFRVGRDKQYPWLTLGNDPNLYGHVPQPGLFVFKSRLGFTPIPSQRFGHSQGDDEADHLLTLDSLSDPAMILAYSSETSGECELPEFRLEVFSRTEIHDLSAYSASFLTAISRTLIS